MIDKILKRGVYFYETPHFYWVNATKIKNFTQKLKIFQKKFCGLKNIY